MKLWKERCLKRQRRNFFRHRVVNRWNMLTDNIVTSTSVNIFKNRLDAFWHVHKCEQSDDFPRTPCTNTRQDQLFILRAEEDVCHVCMYVCMYVCKHDMIGLHVQIKITMKDYVD